VPGVSFVALYSWQSRARRSPRLESPAQRKQFPMELAIPGRELLGRLARRIGRSIGCVREIS
jgi:hypothetical protein